MSWINAESLYPSHIFIVWFKTHCVVYKNWVVVQKQAEENAEEDYWAHILYPLVFSHKLLSFDSLMFVLKKKNVCIWKYLCTEMSICMANDYMCVQVCVCVCICLFVPEVWVFVYMHSCTNSSGLMTELSCL